MSKLDSLPRPVGVSEKFPAGPACLMRFWLERRRQARRQRDGYRRLLDLDDNILADIGLRREQVEDGAQLPSVRTARAEWAMWKERR